MSIDRALHKKFRSQLAPGFFISVASNFIQGPIWLLKFLFWLPTTLFRSQKEYSVYKCIYLYSIARGQRAVFFCFCFGSQQFCFCKPAICFHQPGGDHGIIYTRFCYFGRQFGHHWQPTAHHVEPCIIISWNFEGYLNLM